MAEICWSPAQQMFCKKLILVHLRGFPPWPSNLLKPEVRSKLRMQEVAAAEELARSMKALGEPMTYLMFALAEPVRGKDNPSTQEGDVAGVAAGVAAASVGLMEENTTLECIAAREAALRHCTSVG